MEKTAEIICPEIEKIYIQTDNEVALEEDSYIMPSYSIGTLLGSRIVEDISSGKQLKRLSCLCARQYFGYAGQEQLLLW